MTLLYPLLLSLLLGLGPGPQDAEPAPKQEPSGGPLFVVGGGGTPDTVKALALEMAGGKKARVLIFPQASERKSAGRDNVAMWKEAGARTIKVADLKKKKTLRKEIARANLIWFAGGSQNRLMKALRDAKMIAPIVARHRAGAVLGGTSAGAAVMSTRMLTGDAVSRNLVAKGTALDKGLGLMKDVIVDQHFHARRRFYRLLSAVIDHPKELGIGIDEKTAIVVRGTNFEVVGSSGVLVIDASRAKADPGEKGSPLPFQGVVLHHLVPGQAFDLKTRLPVSEEK